MSIVVTGATGPLGRLIIEHLLERGAQSGEIIGAGRSEEKLTELESALGVRTAVIDYSKPETLDTAFAGADTLMFVSGSEAGQRIEQHRNVVDAAIRAGISRIVYTSAPHADTSTLALAPEHKATEEMIRASGIPFTFLRNNWYTENYVGAFTQATASGTYLASTGDGRVASASRTDFAEAAAAVLTQDGHDGAVYELSGDVAWDGNQLAAAFSELAGRTITFTSVTPEEHAAALRAAGLDEGTIGFLVRLDGDIRNGDLADTSGDLSRLIGRPTTPLVEGLRLALG
ncbi:SDR family oxidoreductase [Mycetocola zhujimingii]|uniref:SDR family oxidoreductase n=1 Tax=Mycetocola zhujimingii TaxID=2079792 RepID=UPI000D39EFCE|nr:SDR family oxidoreductase [Mycetocola zhujimingii]AWB87848.1 NAD(P)-dependent oxidoreductase [Mycetocola zhujimingii]